MIKVLQERTLQSAYEKANATTILKRPTETLLSVGAQKKGLPIRNKRNKRLLFALPYIAASRKPQKTPLQLRNATTAALFLSFTL